MLNMKSTLACRVISGGGSKYEMAGLFAGALSILAISLMALAQPAMAGAVSMSEPTQAGASGLDSIKGRIRASDEEWKVIGPCLEAVIAARRTADYSLAAGSGAQADFGAGRNGRRGRGGGMGRDSFENPDSLSGGAAGRTARDTRGGRESSAPTPVAGTTNRAPVVATPDTIVADNPVALAIISLENALANTNAAPEEIKEKLAAVAGAKEKAKADLAKAQKNLRLLLTPTQQAVLASLGYLD
jgi:hypothetical protein